MTSSSSPSNSNENRKALPGWALWILHALRLFWLACAALLVVAVWGLISGWNTPRQWSDGFFYAAAMQVMVAGITLIGSPTSRQVQDASAARYVSGGNVDEVQQQLVVDNLRQMSFGVRAFFGGIFTGLISLVMLLLGR